MENKVITIFEDYASGVLEFKDHLSNLYFLREIVNSNNFSLQVNGTLQIKHYVGFFQKGNTSLQILPKIYAKSSSSSFDSTEVGTSLDFLYRMLQLSGYLNHKPLPPQMQNKTDVDLLELFINIFINEFIQLYKRKIYRCYQQYEENQQFIKGKILFSETIKRNPILKHLHFVRYDDYSINNLLNQIFKSLILQLLHKTKNSDNKKYLVIGLTYLQEVNLINLTSAHFKKIKFDRLNNEFEPLFNLAKLFFYNLQPGLSEGKENTFSFLVPLHLLFENYVAKICDRFSGNGINFNHHRPKLYLGKEGVKDVFQLEPDFTLTRGQDYLCILDTKYKYPFDKMGNVNINTDDLYQLYTYAMRYNCKLLVLIYPKFYGVENDNELLTEYVLQSSIGDIVLNIIQIDIMDNNLDNVIAPIEKILNPLLCN